MVNKTVEVKLHLLHKFKGKNCPCEIEQKGEHTCPCDRFTLNGICKCKVFVPVEDDE